MGFGPVDSNLVLFGPKRGPKNMKKTIPKKYPKMMAKWPQGVENEGQKGSQNHDKIDINFDPEKGSNIYRKNMNK